MSLTPRELDTLTRGAPKPRRVVDASGYPRGETHHRAKLTDSTVVEIRETFARWRRAGSAKGYIQLGYAFGLSRWTVREIVIGRSRLGAGGPIRGVDYDEDASA